MFYEQEIEDIVLENAPENLAILIINYLCGENSKPNISENDKELLKIIISNGKTKGLNYNQFNELILLLNQDIVGEAFFKFFFEKERMFLQDIKLGIIKFRGYAMLCFGNFRFAYKQLCNKSESEIIQCLSQYCRKSEDIEANY